MDRYSFPVRILHSLLHAGLSRRTDISSTRIDLVEFKRHYDATLVNEFIPEGEGMRYTLTASVRLKWPYRLAAPFVNDGSAVAGPIPVKLWYLPVIPLTASEIAICTIAIARLERVGPNWSLGPPSAWSIAIALIAIPFQRATMLGGAGWAAADRLSATAIYRNLQTAQT